MNVPTYKESLNAEYQESSYRFFDNIFTQGLGLKEMLLSTSGFYGPGMAALYGVTAPASGSYAQGDLGAKRVGYFSQLPYLTLQRAQRRAELDPARRDAEPRRPVRDAGPAGHGRSRRSRRSRPGRPTASASTS